MPIQAASDPVLGEKKEVSPVQSIPVGKFETAPLKVPVDANATRVYVSRNGWPDVKDKDGNSLDVVHIQTWFSFDNGATWEKGTGSTHVGGVWRHRDGTIMSECLPTTYDIPDTKNANRLVKVEVTPLQQALSAAVSVESRQIVKAFA